LLRWPNHAQLGPEHIGCRINDKIGIEPAGDSKISVEDFAVAMIDELEKPSHVRQRFTVGY